MEPQIKSGKSVQFLDEPTPETISSKKKHTNSGVFGPRTVMGWGKNSGEEEGGKINPLCERKF